MSKIQHLIGLLLISFIMVTAAAAALNRQSFPEGFVFGASSSAFQYEGGWNEDGREPSNWDTFTFQFPEKIADHSNATIADDFYHQYKGDVKRIKDLGLDAFRFSISWSRLVPYGKVAKGVNPLGIQFYNNLIDDLLANGIKPYITIFHWDLPQALEDEYGGFLSPKIVDDFRDYAGLCFRLFGDRVRHWITVNEPNLYSQYGYAYGTYAPGRCSSYIGNCSAGNSATEPYLVTHHLLLSHASAFKLYKDSYQEYQKGEVGIVVANNWIVPINQSSANVRATSRAFDFLSGWILDPINLGHYPETMRSLVGNRLPEFTKEQSRLLKQSFDFLGLNYYTSFYGEDDDSIVPPDELSYTTDSRSKSTYYKDGIPIGNLLCHNMPWYSQYGYAYGTYAPGSCSSYIGNCSAGNSATEPYLVTHHLLLSHAYAFKLYKDSYQEYQKGEVGIVVSNNWIVPINQSSANVKATSRAIDFLCGWILDPINLGHYPETMRSLVGNRLPEFTEDQSRMLKHSFDFLGLNYYTSFYGEDDDSIVPPDELSYTTDSRSKLTYYKDSIPIGNSSGCTWLHVYPQGLRIMLSYVKEKYNNPQVILTENGMCDWNNYSLPVEIALQDYSRIWYHSLHLSYLDNEIRNGTNVKGYFLWSLFDDFEWAAGYTNRFGVYYVDYKGGLRRYRKWSAYWFKKFLLKEDGSETKKLRFSSMK